MKKIYFIALGVIPYCSVAAPPPEPTFFQSQNDNSELVRDFAKKAEKSTALSQSNDELAIPQKVSNANELEMLINRTLVEKHWKLLGLLLDQYQQQLQIDNTLYRYAKGAWLRANQRLPEAIALYQQILAEKPELAYPRFDLGVMLFENRQYQDAENELVKSRPALTIPMQGLANRYLYEIDDAQSWQSSLTLQYVQTQNVNNASSEREIWLGGMRFLKDEDSLPQSARGVHYGLELSREKNLGGNHFLYMRGEYSGVYYWDNKDYSEQTVRADLGYRWRNAMRTIGFIPFVEQNWLGKSRYSHNWGGALEFRQQLNAKWQFTSNFSHLRKHYDAPLNAKRHNGFINQLSIGLNWQSSPHWLWYVSVDGNRDHSREKAESSHRFGGNFGVVYATQTWRSQASVRYARRKFHSENFYTGFNRRDHERQINLTLWHNKLQWKGFVPRLNYRYQKINSNIPQFYSRKNSELFLTVEKMF